MNDPIAAGTFSADAFAGDTAVVVPGVAVLELVLDAARSIGAAGVGDLRLTRPIVLPDVGELCWQILAGPLSGDGRRAVDFRVRRETWVSHATGELFDDATADGRDGFVDTADWPARTLADAVRRDGRVPVRWRDVELRPGAVRARTVWDGDRGRVWLVDRHGDPAGYVDEVVMAPPDVEAVRAEPVEHVYRVSCREVAPTLREAPGDRVVVDLTGVPDPVETALAHARSGARELVFLIDDSLACAPVRGLVRSLRVERPEWTVRLVEARADAVPAAVTAALDAVAPELVVAGNAFLEPELVPAALTGGRPVLDPDGTVLITGGTGDLGRLVAAHLVAAHGIRHLLLVSRRGPDAPGVADLVADLTRAGAHTVRVVAADVADRAQVAAALAEVSPRHPLTAVLHLAGVVDARLVEGQDNARFRRVLAPKVRGAWHLHELTRDAPLAAFVLFSSVASVFGGAGQSNYAAANAYLDALAAHRHVMGLVATSVSWGPWDGRGLGADLGEAEVARLRRQGVVPLTERQGRRILDAAIAQDAPHLVAAVLTPPATVAPADLASLPVEDRWPATVALVRREAAVVLGAPVGSRQVLGDAGVDSLMALELRNRLTAATAVALPATLVTDHPTPTAIARLLVARLAPAVPRAPAVGVVGVALGGSVPQTVWAALENAGVVPESLRGRRVGVFLGVPEGDAAGRVAALFRLRGPAVTVCGSPLVAVHLARVALLREECELALAGGDGVVVLAPSTDSSRAALIDSALEGTGGATMADLSAAVAERRWAELAGPGARLTVEPSGRRTARAGKGVGRLGRSAGEATSRREATTGVEGVAEESVPGRMGAAMGRLGVLPGGEVGSGDAVAAEVGGVAEEWLAPRRVEPGVEGRGVSLGEGSGRVVAADVGEGAGEWSAPGAGGLCALPDEGPGVRVAEGDASRWLASRRVCGAGSDSAGSVGGPVVPVVVSGLDVEGLRRQARRWAEWLEVHPEVSLAGVARTAALCRTQFRVRGVVVAAELGDVVDGLWAVARGEAHPRVVHGVARRGAGVVFASSGHSGPWVVPQLLRESRVFARAVARYEALLRPLLGWSVTDVLAGDGELDLEHPEVVRVAGLVGRVATAAALRGLGVVPTGGREVVVPLVPVAGGLAGLMRVLAGVHVRGGPVLWERALPAGDLVDLPPYVFAPPVGAGSPG